MTLFSRAAGSFYEQSEWSFAKTLSRLAYCNAFLPERVELERQALGPEFELAGWAHHYLYEMRHGQHPNVGRLYRRGVELADRARQRLAEGAKPSSYEEGRLYEDLILFRLYTPNSLAFDEVIDAALERKAPLALGRLWGQFSDKFEHYFLGADRTVPSGHEPAHAFACFFQVRRAFYHIFRYIVGTSDAVTRLRGAVWQSIFSADMRRWTRALYDRMGEFTTLITGPSGTGKELVARAVGQSRYIRFDPKKKEFGTDFAGSFHALNLSAFTPTLIESELFGHVKGAFNGAVDREGWLEKSDKWGTVFLDEIGEVDLAVQVKLLRVIQERKFSRVGKSALRDFNAKLIVATNRDLAAEMRAGRFREDFYYRLCGDVITTPSLREQLDGAPDDLYDFVLFVARRIAGEQEAPSLAEEVAEWVKQNLGRDYPWRGNFRELEQCVRNVLIRREYHPPCPNRPAPGGDSFRSLADDVAEGRLTADELEFRYFKLMHARCGTYQQAARRLKRDWRTVKSVIEGETPQTRGGRNGRRRPSRARRGL